VSRVVGAVARGTKADSYWTATAGHSRPARWPPALKAPRSWYIGSSAVASGCAWPAEYMEIRQGADTDLGWLRGYYLEENAEPVVDIEKVFADLLRLTQHCQGRPD
jgi:hypothetical protein